MLLDKNTIINVKNRDNGTVGYTIPDLGNLHRLFQPGETKEITMEELRKLSYIPGGTYIIKQLLVLDNEDAIKELCSNVEPEYYYNNEDIKNLLINGSLDQLDDCLTFGPNSVIDQVKELAINMPLNDVAKRDLIFKKTGLNITSAIEINKISEEPEEEEEKASVRKAEPINATATTTTTGRKAAPITNSKYKIVK